MLYIVATPIGNLGDFSHRAKETLESVEYILCEDTRTSRVLLDRYEIKKPLKSFHKFNEAEMENSVFEDLSSGKNIALISDAGTPGISDPGERLIQGCVNQNLPMTHIPGPAALIMALILSGFNTTPFQYLGFLPKKTGEYKAAIDALLTYPGVSIVYESPHRLLKLLELLPKTRALSIGRELTKKFEEIKRGKAEDLLKWFTEHPPRGEIVVVIDQGTDIAAPPLTLKEEWAKLADSGSSKNESIRLLSQKFKLTKREISSQLDLL